MLSTILLMAVSALPAQELLVSPEQLAAMPAALVVDARAEGDFKGGHIPGAATLDVEDLSETRRGVVGLLKTPRELRQLIAKAGVDPAKHVVVYSGNFEASDVKRATRLFWILEVLDFPKVSLLNGGLAKWKAESRPVEQGSSKVAPIAPKLIADKLDEKRFAERSEVLKQIEQGSGTLLDLRVADEYAGKSKKEFVQVSGHIPSAKSCPAAGFFTGPYFEFKTGDDLNHVLGATILNPKGPVTTYCNTGRDATIGYLGLRLSGIDEVRVYDGSMAEWGSRPGAKVE